MRTTLESKFRFTTMPTPSVDYADGKPYQYIGATTQDYTNGYFYKCVAQGTDPETYAWEQTNVQPTSVGDERIKSEITEMGVEITYIGGIKLHPYIIAKPSFPEFNTDNLEDIVGVIDEYYNGNISLEEIRNAWSLGDKISISTDAISATPFYQGQVSAQAQQTKEWEIIDFNHDNLVTPINGKTKALLTISMVTSFNTPTAITYRKGDADYVGDGYSVAEVRSWLNKKCYNAMPELIQGAVKTVTKQTNKSNMSLVTTNEKIFIPTQIEYSNNTESNYYGRGGTLYERYVNVSNRNHGNKVWTSSSYDTSGFMYLTTNGATGINFYASPADTTIYLAPAMCM